MCRTRRLRRAGASTALMKSRPFVRQATSANCRTKARNRRHIVKWTDFECVPTSLVVVATGSITGYGRARCVEAGQRRTRS